MPPKLGCLLHCQNGEQDAERVGCLAGQLIPLLVSLWHLPSTQTIPLDVPPMPPRDPSFKNNYELV